MRLFWRRGVSTLFFLVGLLSLSAHDADIARFRITVTKNAVVVDAELPWVIINDLQDHYPELEKATTVQAFVEALKDYFSKRLQIFDASGSNLKLEDLQILTGKGHSHQEDYRLFYSAGFPAKICNTVLFAIEEKQSNLHELKQESYDTISFELNRDTTCYYVPKVPSDSIPKGLSVAVALLLLFATVASIRSIQDY